MDSWRRRLNHGNTPTVDQEAFVGHAIESGPFRRAEDAVEETLSLRAEFLATLDEAEASLRHAAKDAS
ncbi:MAG TPA: hypothetical protein VIH75_21395 [Candidatus Sulfotelmatobacter sp.]|jgi:hypothetical protein